MASSFRSSTPRAAQADTFWGRLSPTTRHAACLGIMLVVALAFYAPAIFEGKNIRGTDTITFRANAQVTVEHYEKTGERPLWAPNVFSGMPYINYKNVVPQVDTLVNLVRGAYWPVSILFVLMAGVYFLVFYLTRDHWSGLLSGLAFGFTTYIPIIIGVGHGTKFVALAYAPYVLLAFAYVLRNPSLLGGLLFAGALAIELRASHPQITFYVGMFLALWWLVEVIGAVREERISTLAVSTGWPWGPSSAWPWRPSPTGPGTSTSSIRCGGRRPRRPAVEGAGAAWAGPRPCSGVRAWGSSLRSSWPTPSGAAGGRTGAPRPLP
ncbi:MAG: hypothetical protein ABEK84_03715, partial [Salinibacter sp.]